MHLNFFLLIVVSLSCGSLPPRETDLGRAILATFGMVLAWWILCHVAARNVARQVIEDQISEIQGARWLEIQLEIFRWLGLAVVLLCLGGFGLASEMRQFPLLEQSMFFQAVLLLIPAILLVAASWSAEHRYGVWVGYIDRGIAAHLSFLAGSFRSGMAWLVIPILMLLAGGDMISMLPLSEHQAIAVMIVSMLLFVCVGLPSFVAKLFRTERLDHETEAWVRALVTAAGLRRTKAVCWQTHGKSFNAMIAGFLPPFRTLLLSDRLILELPRDQVAMVILHEAAHLRRHHVPLRMMSVLPAWGLGAMVTYAFGDASWGMVVGSITAIVVTLFILRTVAYRTEFDADVQACRMAERVSRSVDGVPSDYDEAAAVLCRALVRVTSDSPSAQKATWLHPSVADRIAVMRRERVRCEENSESPMIVSL